MRTSKWVFVTFVLLALIVFGASASWAVVTHPVDIVKDQPWFTPVQIIVNVGDSVTWTNNDPNTTHTVTALAAAGFGAGIGPVPVGTTFTSGKMLPGDTFTAGPFGPGTTPYICLIHPWMAGNVSAGVGVGPVPDVLQGTDTQDMATPDLQGVIGIGEWCTTATYEHPHQGQFGGVVHCGSAHLWRDASPSNPRALEDAISSGVTAANGFPTSSGDLVACGNGHRAIGGRFEGATTTHNLWNNNHFTPVGAPIGPAGVGSGVNTQGFGNPAGSVIAQPVRQCFTFSTNLHGQTFQWIARTPVPGQGIVGSTNTLFAGDVTHVMTNPGGTVGWVTMEAGQNGNTGNTSGSGTITGHLGIFDPNNPPAQVTNFIDLGSNFPHGNWVCADGIHDTVPAPLSNTIGVVQIPTTPGGASGGQAFFPSFGGGVYPVATGTMPNCMKSYTSNAVDHRLSVHDAMSGVGLANVELGTCTTCTLMGAPVPSVHIPIQITPSPDNRVVVVQVSKASLLAVVTTGVDLSLGAPDTVVAQMDCGNGCHGSYMGPKRGGGFYLVASAAYQDKMSIMDMTTLTKVGDVKTNMSSLLGLQGTTPLGDPNIMTLSPAVGWNSGTIAWPQMPPWK